MFKGPISWHLWVGCATTEECTWNLDSPRMKHSVWRNFNDWKIATLSEFYRQQEEFEGIQEGIDKLWWKEDSRVSKVSSTYKFLIQGNQQLHQWPWKHTWKVKIPAKVACFTWLLAREVLFVLDVTYVVKRRGYDSQPSISTVQDYDPALEDIC